MAAGVRRRRFRSVRRSDWQRLEDELLAWLVIALVLGGLSWLLLGCAATDTQTAGGRVRTLELARQVEVQTPDVWVCHHAASPGLVTLGMAAGGLAGAALGGPAAPLTAAAGAAGGGVAGAAIESLAPELVPIAQRDFCGRPEKVSAARAATRRRSVEQEQNTGSISATATRVIDGDTIDARLSLPLAPLAEGELTVIRRVRVYGIDAPELHGRCDRERELARDAAARLSELLAKAERVELEPLHDADKYGRMLAAVKADGQDVAAALVSEGLAHSYHGVGPRQGWCQ